MAEKRYTVVFDAKDNASARLSAMEQQARKTSRGISSIQQENERVSASAGRLGNSYNVLNSRLGNTTGRFTRFSDLLRRSNGDMDRSGSVISRMATGLARVGSEGMSSVSRLTAGLSGVTGVLGGITAAAGIAGVALAGLAAKGVWDHMIKPAMDVESTKLQINALSGSPEKGTEIYKMSQKFAKGSIYENEDIMGGTFSFMQNTKNVSELEDMLSITQRLATLNKEEGFRGASFSLKEAMSGDITSIAERFNVGKKDLRSNGFDSAADWKTNLNAVDKSLEKINITDAFVDAMEESGPAQLAKLKKNLRSTAAASGNGMAEELRPEIKKINMLFEDEKGIARFTSSMSARFRGALQDVFGFGDGIQITWDNITNWSESTFDGVSNVMSSTGEMFGTLITTLAGGDLTKPQETFANFGSVLDGIARKIDSLKQGFIELDQWGDKVGKMTGIGQEGGMQKQIDDGAWWLPEGAKGGRGLLPWAFQGFPSERQKDGSHALGLSYVPKNKYNAELHEGERVLTKQENIDYTQGTGNQSSGGVVITGNTFNVRSDSDIDAIGEALYMRLQARG